MTCSAHHADSNPSNLKKTLTFGFKGGWLVNGARASPTNFSSSCTGMQRPVISFLDQPIIHVTFGLVEYSNLITPSAGGGGRKSISLTVLDTEFDLAWAYYCTVLGVKGMQLYSTGSNQYVAFSTYPPSSSTFSMLFVYLCSVLTIGPESSSGSTPSTPARFKKFVKAPKAATDVQQQGAVINKGRPAAISKLLQAGNRHVVGPDADSKSHWFDVPF